MDGNQMLNHNFAYFAGFFDGEGTVDIRARQTHNSKYLRFELRVSIPQVIDAPLIKAQSIWGGSLVKGKRINTWSCASKLAVQFLSDIYPYLIVKKDEVEIALAFANLIGSYERTAKEHGGFAKESQDRINSKLYYFHELRYLRELKGFARKNRNTLLAS
jgi:hypothetical protein